MRSSGSSPLTRGTLALRFLHGGLRRFIPAYAGNSGVFMSNANNGTVHPRLRGELSWPRREPFASCGSSPLTRGTHDVYGVVSRGLRFIPAYAGNSNFSELSTIKISVHPRLRGELSSRVTRVIEAAGSSPLTRGTRWLILHFCPLLPVHPRLRGELRSAASSAETQCGSSPLTRGTLSITQESRRGRRFIPAYAGNSPNARRREIIAAGSSPLTRGTHLRTV